MGVAGAIDQRCAAKPRSVSGGGASHRLRPHCLPTAVCRFPDHRSLIAPASFRFRSSRILQQKGDCSQSRGSRGAEWGWDTSMNFSIGVYFSKENVSTFFFIFRKIFQEEPYFRKMVYIYIYFQTKTATVESLLSGGGKGRVREQSP